MCGHETKSKQSKNYYQSKFCIANYDFIFRTINTIKTNLFHWLNSALSETSHEKFNAYIIFFYHFISKVKVIIFWIQFYYVRYFSVKILRVLLEPRIPSIISPSINWFPEGEMTSIYIDDMFYSYIYTYTGWFLTTIPI